MARFQESIQPILIDYCYRCHADGMKKGGVAFDEVGSDEALVKRSRPLVGGAQERPRRDHAAGRQAAADSPRRSQVLADWIKHDVFGIDPDEPDPGRVTIRRLNRVEYRNTIRDLMGIDFKAEEEFPPDDTGYGFDNIGDVLTRLAAAAGEVLPGGRDHRQDRRADGLEAHRRSGPIGASSSAARRSGLNGDRLAFSKAGEGLAVVQRRARRAIIDLPLELAVQGRSKLDPGRCTVVFKVDDRELLRETYAGQASKTFHYDVRSSIWPPATIKLSLRARSPGEPESRPATVGPAGSSPVDASEGPLGRGAPGQAARTTAGSSPGRAARRRPERRQYAREVLGRFAGRAFRRPVDDRTLDRLVAIAESVYRLPGKTFEEGRAGDGGRPGLAPLPLPRRGRRARPVGAGRMPRSTNTPWRRGFPISSGRPCPTTSCSGWPSGASCGPSCRGRSSGCWPTRAARR